MEQMFKFFTIFCAHKADRQLQTDTTTQWMKKSYLLQLQMYRRVSLMSNLQCFKYQRITVTIMEYCGNITFYSGIPNPSRTSETHRQEPVPGVQPLQLIPGEHGSRGIGPVWENLVDVGGPSQSVVMHQERHPVKTGAGT